MQRPELSFRARGARRLIIGVVVGVAFASSFYFASLAVSRATFAIVRNQPEAEIARIHAHNEFAQAHDIPLRQPPTIIGPAEAEIPAWVEPFWAGLAAVFGQAIALSFWLVRPQVPWSLRRKRAGLHARSSAATGLMWIGLVPLVLVKLWFVYLVLVYGGNVWASAFGGPITADPLVPFVPFGLSAALLVVILALEPWRGIQLVYRCRWWPAVSVLFTLALGVLLFVVGRWVFPFI